jgi:hypothetical protein
MMESSGIWNVATNDELLAPPELNDLALSHSHERAVLDGNVLIVYRRCDQQRAIAYAVE